MPAPAQTLADFRHVDMSVRPGGDAVLAVVDFAHRNPYADAFDLAGQGRDPVHVVQARAGLLHHIQRQDHKGDAVVLEKAHVLVEKLKEGQNIALITDAGTPGISDPGEDLVRICQEEGVPVTSLPGACACVTALTLSGLPTRRFCFEAFLPAEKKDRQQVLAELKEESRTMIIYEAPHRLVRTLTELQEVLGDRRLTICRELTKKHETAFATTFSQALAFYREQDPKGECVLVIEGKSFETIRKEQQESWESLTIPEHMEHYLSQGMDKKTAMKQVAKDRGVGKRDIYQALL